MGKRSKKRQKTKKTAPPVLEEPAIESNVPGLASPPPTDSWTAKLMQWAIILGVFGFIMPGINNWAHGGGFAAGWVAAQLMSLDDDRQDSSWVLLASLGLIAVTLLGIGLSLYYGHDLCGQAFR